MKARARYSFRLTGELKTAWEIDLNLICDFTQAVCLFNYS